MLAQDERAQPGHVRGREAVAGAAQRPASEPGDVDVEAPREELDRRVRVGVEGEGIVELVAADRDDAREAPREALDRHVVRRGDEHVPLEVRGVGERVKLVDVLLLRRRQAHVDDVEALGDRPLEPGDHHRSAARIAGSQDADADELALRSERSDDPGACGPVAAEVAGVVVGDRDLVAVARDRDRALHDAHQRMVELDPAVEHADARAGAGRAAEGPLARDPFGEGEGDPDRLAGSSREAPGGKVFLRLVLVRQNQRVRHCATILRGAL